jgi:AcrR family transcriptional regulator
MDVGPLTPSELAAAESALLTVDGLLSDSATPRRARGRPPKTLDERDEGNRRQALLRAAARLFHRNGYDATSTRDIAAAVGMHSGSPFYHFKSKSALLYAVMEEGMRAAIERQNLALQALGLEGSLLLNKECRCSVRYWPFWFEITLMCWWDAAPISSRSCCTSGVA